MPPRPLRLRLSLQNKCSDWLTAPASVCVRSEDAYSIKNGQTAIARTLEFPSTPHYSRGSLLLEYKCPTSLHLQGSSILGETGRNQEGRFGMCHHHDKLRYLFVLIYSKAFPVSVSNGEFNRVACFGRIQRQCPKLIVQWKSQMFHTSLTF